MKQYVIAATLFAMETTFAWCPDCDIAANTTFTVEPSIIDKDNQTVKLTATINCPRDTWFHAFTGYTIYWGDDASPNPELVLYDLELHNYQQCMDNRGVACGNANSKDHRDNLSGYTTFTKSHTYKDKKSHDVTVSFTLLQNKNTYSSSTCGSTGATSATKVQMVSTSINATPFSYCAIPKGYALFATENLTINDRVSCSKNEYSSSICTAGAEKNIIIGVKGTVDNAHSNETLTLRNYAKVYSDAWAKTIEAQKGAEYKKKGDKTSFNYDSEIGSIPYTNTSEFIESGKTKTYNPGVYGDVTVRRDGTLILNSDGVYFFKNIRFETGSTLKLKSSKTTELYAQEFNFSGTVSGAKASNFLVGVLGTSGTYVDNGFTGSIWAPHSRMVIGQFHHKTYRGSYLAKELVVPQDTKIDYVQFTKTGACK
ncbi:hypothetical protein [uncultured Fibrobacter sp.]|uniref:hypothetical protein n=1 Tax=uncultured Fibrobacter sp. TaxID=261512 RepID=UPI002804740C|nr:hypothetical protein [uncultured Fibrobacter sp.]